MPPKRFELPFLTRDMLNFEQSSQFTLRVISIAAITGTVVIRGATRAGLFTYKHALAATDAENTQNFNISDIPIWLTATISATGALGGEVFVRIGLGINGDVIQNLMSGYLYDTKTLDWPLMNENESLPVGQGRLRTLSDDVVTAGQNPVLSGSLSRMWKIKYANVTLVTSATVANRRVHFVVGPQAPISLNFLSSVDQTASTSRVYTFAPVPSAGTYNDDNDILVPISDNIVGYDEGNISLATTNLQAGDQFSNFRVVVEEWVYAGTF